MGRVIYWFLRHPVILFAFVIIVPIPVVALSKDREAALLHFITGFWEVFLAGAVFWLLIEGAGEDFRGRLWLRSQKLTVLLVIDELIELVCASGPDILLHHGFGSASINTNANKGARAVAFAAAWSDWRRLNGRLRTAMNEQLVRDRTVPGVEEMRRVIGLLDKDSIIIGMRGRFPEVRQIVENYKNAYEVLNQEVARYLLEPTTQAPITLRNAARTAAEMTIGLCEVCIDLLIRTDILKG